MKRILFLSIVVLGALALTLNSCKKTKPDTETQSAVDNSVCEGEFTRTMNVVNSFGIREQGVKSVESTCPAVTLSDTIANQGAWPRTLTVNYGTGCYDSIDHKTRKGSIICVFSNRWHTDRKSTRL